MFDCLSWLVRSSLYLASLLQQAALKFHVSAVPNPFLDGKSMGSLHIHNVMPSREL